MYYVYLLKYTKSSSSKHYIGCTKDLEMRIEEHKDGAGCQTTQNVDDSTQWKLIYYEAYRTQSAAYDREEKLKQYGSALQRLKKRIQR